MRSFPVLVFLLGIPLFTCASLGKGSWNGNDRSYYRVRVESSFRGRARNGNGYRRAGKEGGRLYRATSKRFFFPKQDFGFRLFLFSLVCGS